jgi:signal peptidase II
MGNLGDRIFRAPGLFRGYVVDWIGVVPRYYPIFNLADSAIVCGGILTVVLAMRGYHLDGTRSVDDHSVEDHGAAEHGDRPAGPGARAGENAGENTERAESAEPTQP